MKLQDFNTKFIEKVTLETDFLAIKLVLNIELWRMLYNLVIVAINIGFKQDWKEGHI